MSGSRHISRVLFAGFTGFLACAVSVRADSEDRSPHPLSAAARERVDEVEQRITELLDRRAYSEALPLAREVAALRSTEQGEDWWESVDARLRVKVLEEVGGWTAEKQQWFTDLQAEGERMMALHAEGRVHEALAAARSRASGLSDMLGGDAQEVLRARILVARLLSATGDYPAAEAMHRDVLAARRRLLGEDHPEVGESLNDVGVQLYFQGKYQTAERHYRKALAVRRRTRGKDHVDVGQSLNNLAASYMVRGNYEPAEPLYVEALRIWRAAYGPDHPEVAAALSNFGNLCRYQGDYVRAELLYREAVAIRRRASDPDAVRMGVALNNLASMLQARGDYAAAKPLYQEALEILRESLGSNHDYTAAAVNNFATLLKDDGSYKQAEPLYREALAVRRAKLGADHPIVAGSLNNLGRLLALQKAYDDAERAYRDALAIWRRVYPEAHPDIGEGLTNLGALLTEMGRYDEAEASLREGLAMQRELLGAGHPDVVVSLFELAKLQRERGAFVAAEGVLREALSMALAARPRIASDEEGRAAYADATRLPAMTAALADTLVRLDRPEDAFDVLERGRSRAALDLLARSEVDLIVEAESRLGEDESREFRRLLQRESDARAAVRQAETRLTSRDSTGSGNDTDAAERAALRAARLALEEAEAAVLAKLLDVWPEAQPANAKAIRRQLEPGEMILTFNWTPLGVSTLCVPASGVNAVSGRLIAEGREAVRALEDLANRMRREIQNRAVSVKGSDDASYQLWERLVPESMRDLVLSARRLIVIPDGPLRYVPLEALAPADVSTAGGSRLLEAGPPIVYADSGTVFVNRRSARRAQNGHAPAQRWSALILADPAFTAARADRFVDPGPAEGAALVAWSSRSVADPRVAKAEVSALDQIRLYGGTLRPLPGTRDEAQAIMQIVERAGGQADVLTGRAASLTTLESQVQGSRFLHLATHGLVGSAVRPLDASLALARPVEPTPDDIGFLTLDRLIRAWRGKLQGCELAVLSACDTRVGIERGDSDWALPWGFMYAGTPSVLASLWKVDDQATRLLMQRFYENLLGQYTGRRGGHAAGVQMAKDEALREAKMWLRCHSLPASAAEGARGGLVAAPVLLTEENDENTFSDPYYWAGFVLLGAPD